MAYGFCLRDLYCRVRDVFVPLALISRGVGDDLEKRRGLDSYIQLM